MSSRQISVEDLHDRERILVERYSSIRWFEPQSISIIGHSGNHLACRFCIALHGTTGQKILSGEGTFPSRDAFYQHLLDEHCK